MNNIEDYYSSINKETLEELCKNTNIKNLIYLSVKNNINIFDKKNNIKKKNNLIKECNQKKKNEIKSKSIELSNLAKLNETNINNIKEIYNRLESNVKNIDEMVNYIESNDINNIHKNKYIECYSNC